MIYISYFIKRSSKKAFGIRKMPVLILTCVLITVILSSCHQVKEREKIREANRIQNGKKVPLLASLTERIFLDSLSYSYSFSLYLGDSGIVIETTCYSDGNLFDADFDYSNYGGVKRQLVHFLVRNDTLRSIEIPHRSEMAKLKNGGIEVPYSLNVVQWVSIISGKNGSFFYLSGGEDCVNGCPEYWSFMSFSGNVIWEQYLKETGRYDEAFNIYEVSNDILTPNSIQKFRVHPFKFAGESLKSSVIRPAKE